MALIQSLKSMREKQAGRLVPAIGLTKKDPQLAAMVSKAVQGNMGSVHDAEGNRKALINNVFAFRSILQKRAKRNADAKAIMKLLPDIELAAQILVSSILSPKDMTSTDLIYIAPKGLLSSELQATMLSRIHTYFEEEYRIKDYLSEMVREPLFETGSYPIAVIPENAIDEIINGGKRVNLESFSTFFNTNGSPKPVGILGPRDKQADALKKIGSQSSNKFSGGLSLESFGSKMDLARRGEIDANVHYNDESYKSNNADKLFNDTAENYLTVTDNVNVLKAPKILEEIKRNYVHAAFNDSGMFGRRTTGMESVSKVNDYQVERAIFRTRNVGADPVATLKTQHELTRKTVGVPMVLRLPTESVLPVHVPGNPKHHIGYFVMLDEEGNPVSCPDGDQMHPGLQNDASNSVTSNLIKKVGMNLGDRGDAFDPLNSGHIQYATQLYSDMVERDLISRVKNGIYSSNVAIAKNDEVYRLMLSRILQRKHTQLLYIPKEYLTYIAFRFGDDGIGRSMLDEQVMINTLRSVLLFNDVLGSVKNAIGRTKVTATIDKLDPNPMKTVEHLADEIVRSRTLGIPLGVSNPADIMEFIQRAGYEFEFMGNDGLPDTKFEFQQTNTQYQKSDDGINESLRKASIMGFGLSPETVDNGFNTEFATTATNNNILFAKRVIVWQDIFTPLISEHMRQMLSYSEGVLEDLRSLLENADAKAINLEIEDVPETKGQSLSDELKKRIIVDRALQLFIRDFKVELPRPASVTVGSQAEELTNYASLLDVGLDAYLSSDLFAKTVVGEIADEANTVRTSVRAYFMRKFMAEKNILPELAALVTADEGGQPQLNVMEQVSRHIEAITKAGVLALVALQANRKAADADLTKAGVTVGDNGDTSSSSGIMDSGSGGDDFGGGFDEGAFGDSTSGGDDTPADDLNAVDASVADEPTEPTEGNTTSESENPTDTPEEKADDAGKTE